MQYMLLIYGDEQGWGSMSDEERNAVYGDYLAFTTAIRESGAFVDGAPLQPTSTATCVQVRSGEQLVTDGPFAETKEQLGGFYLVEAENVDAAIELAARIPGARYGTIEVRPVMPMGAEAASA
jgi:hypothetical protein